EHGLIHRDIKPGNLLVDRQGVLKILDFGLARFFSDNPDGLTQQYTPNAILGTADYLAPEQALNSSAVDIRADIYALGGTLYFLLIGQPPFAGLSTGQKLTSHQVTPPRRVDELRPDIDPDLADVLARMLAKAPAERFQQPAEVAQTLAPWAGDEVRAAV